ncbi:MAG: hypothetical protein K8R21_06360 [Leptospira sp.]|nr:hypothetical protein [Leptospira sp.]
MMLLIFLGQEKPILKMPEGSFITLFIAIAIIVIATVAFFVVNNIIQKSKVKDIQWDRVLAFILKKGFSQKEVSVLEDFFGTLSGAEKESFNPVINKKLCYSMLYGYLVNNERVPADMRVQVMSKLFFERQTDFEPKTTMDLHTGEACSLEMTSKNIFTVIMKQTASKLLLKNNKQMPEENNLSIPVSVYAFRNGFGGFALLGNIIAVVKEGIVFDHNGKIEARGEQHQMTSIELPFELRTSIISIRDSGHNPAKGGAASISDTINELDELLGKRPAPKIEKTTESVPAPKHTFKEELKSYGMTEKISDRGLIFRFVSAPPEDLMKRNEIWEISLKLPNGFTFVCRGVIVQAGARQGAYLFKYTEISETAKKIIIGQIRDLGAEREQF